MARLKTKFIEDSAISTAKIANNAVDADKLASSVAGNGLTGGAGSALAVGAGDGIDVAADAISVDVADLAGSGLENDGSNNLRIASSAAGAGLTGGSGSALAVGAGDGISVAADSVAVDNTVIRSNGSVAFGADQSMGGFKLTNLGAPSSASDAATKSYVDEKVNDFDYKMSVRLASAAALPASSYNSGNKRITADANGALSVDGISPSVNDRILIKNESTGSRNGIYKVIQVGDGSNPFILERSEDADSSEEITSGIAMFVNEGTVNADSGYFLATNDPIVLDTTSLSFTQFTGLGQVTAGAGLTKTGNTLDVGAGDGIDVGADSISVDVSDLAGDGLENDGSNNLRLAASVAGNGLAHASGVLSVNVDDSTIEINSDSLRVKDAGITSAKLAAAVAGAGLTGGAGSALAVGAGQGISVAADSVAVKIATNALKFNGSDEIEAAKPAKESFTLGAGDITNQYVDLQQVILASSLRLFPVGGPEQVEGMDYTISLTGGAGGKTRVSFAGDLATGGDAALVSGDILKISYMYL